MAKVKVTLTHRGVRIVELFPVCNQASRTIVEKASSKKEAFLGQNTLDLEGNQLEFILGNDANPVDLAVYEWDEDSCETGDEIMSEEDYDWDAGGLEGYLHGLEIEGGRLILRDKEYGQVLYDSLNDALKAVLDKKVAPQDFVLEAMRRGLVRASGYPTLSDENEDAKQPHYGVVSASQMEESPFSVSYTIDLEDGEEFDPYGLQFLFVNCGNDTISPVIRKKVGLGAILLNIALYKGKAYFAGHDDCLEDGGMVEAEKSDYDVIGMDLSSRKISRKQSKKTPTGSPAKGGSKKAKSSDSVSRNVGPSTLAAPQKSTVPKSRVQSKAVSKTDHVIHFETNGGDPQKDLTVAHRKKADLRWARKTGYCFQGWYTDPELSTPFDESTRITQDLTLYAGWGFTLYLMVCTREANGKLFPSFTAGYVKAISRANEMDECRHGNMTFLANQKVTVSVRPQPGYVFLGWYLENQGGFSEEPVSTEAVYSFVLEESLTLGALLKKSDG